MKETILSPVPVHLIHLIISAKFAIQPTEILTILQWFAVLVIQEEKHGALLDVFSRVDWEVSSCEYEGLRGPWLCWDRILMWCRCKSTQGSTWITQRLYVRRG